MTRKEWIRKLTFKGKNMQGWNDRMHLIVNSMFDDFESRACKNCKHHKDIGKSYRTCYEIELNTSDDFGCVLFERKEDD